MPSYVQHILREELDSAGKQVDLAIQIACTLEPAIL